MGFVESQERIDDRLDHDGSLAEVEEEIIDPAPYGEERKAALRPFASATIPKGLAEPVVETTAQPRTALWRRLVLPLMLAAALLAPAPAALAEDGDDGSVPSDRFGRLFPDLPPASEPSDALTDAIAKLGTPGGPLDAKDALDRGPIDLIAVPSLSDNNPKHTAGTTFLGQFVDHDLTRDAGSPLGVPTEPGSIENLRTPSFDLDSVYGEGPSRSSELYDPTDRVKLRVERVEEDGFEDLPRRSDDSAIVGDDRNDENLVIAGLHAAFLKFHNHAVDVVREQGTRNPHQVFERARQLTRWHYQWVVLHEFLPQIVGQKRVDQALKLRKFFHPETPFIPVEFQSAAYRFGHSQVRPSYRANLAGDNGGPFFAFIFDPSQFGKPDPDDLTGGSRAARRFIGWQTFFDFGDGEMRPNKRIDTKISTPLFQLPVGTLPGGRGPASLAHRNLLRGLTWSLPSGQRIARQMGAGAVPERPLRARRLRPRPRARHAALVLHPQGGSGHRGRAAARPGRRWHRRRGLRRPARARRELLPEPERVATNAALPAAGRVHDGGLPQVRRRRPRLARPVGARPAQLVRVSVRGARRAARSACSYWRQLVASAHAAAFLDGARVGPRRAPTQGSALHRVRRPCKPPMASHQATTGRTSGKRTSLRRSCLCPRLTSSGTQSTTPYPAWPGATN